MQGNQTRDPVLGDGPCGCSSICLILHSGESNQRPSAWGWALWVQLYLLVSSLRGIERKTKCIGMGLVDVFDGVYLSDSSLMEIETFKSSENLLCIFNYFLYILIPVQREPMMLVWPGSPFFENDHHNPASAMKFLFFISCLCKIFHIIFFHL